MLTALETLPSLERVESVVRKPLVKALVHAVQVQDSGPGIPDYSQ